MLFAVTNHDLIYSGMLLWNALTFYNFYFHGNPPPFPKLVFCLHTPECAPLATSPELKCTWASYEKF